MEMLKYSGLCRKDPRSKKGSCQPKPPSAIIITVDCTKVSNVFALTNSGFVFLGDLTFGLSKPAVLMFL